MPRMACLIIPDVSLCAALRAEPELRDRFQRARSLLYKVET